jgi:hypothetical protein
MQNITANRQRIETPKTIDIFENAFCKIKEATGVSDINEMIHTIVSHEGATENAISLTRACAPAVRHRRVDDSLEGTPSMSVLYSQEVGRKWITAKGRRSLSFFYAAVKGDVSNSIWSNACQP